MYSSYYIDDRHEQNTRIIKRSLYITHYLIININYLYLITIYLLV